MLSRPHRSDRPLQRTLPSPAQVLFVQIAMFRELVNVRYSRRKFKDVPLFRTSQWGWFVTCLLYSYGRTLSEPDRAALLEASSRSPSLITSLPARTIAACLPYVDLGALILYSTGLVLTVLSFKKGYYKYQVRTWRRGRGLHTVCHETPLGGAASIPIPARMLMLHPIRLVDSLSPLFLVSRPPPPFSLSLSLSLFPPVSAFLRRRLARLVNSRGR
jgi:hypothetical protein